MANIFQDKTMKYLTIGLVLIIIGMLAHSFLLARPEPLSVSPTVTIEDLLQTMPKVPAAAFDSKNLDNLKVENLKSFDLVSFPSKVGRSNPFDPYPLTEEIYSTTSPAVSNKDFSTSTITTEQIATPTSTTTNVP